MGTCTWREGGGGEKKGQREDLKGTVKKMTGRRGEGEKTRKVIDREKDKKSVEGTKHKNNMSLIKGGNSNIGLKINIMVMSSQ